MSKTVVVTKPVTLPKSMQDRGWRAEFKTGAWAHGVSVEFATIRHGIFRSTFMLTLAGPEDDVARVIGAFEDVGMRFK